MSTFSSQDSADGAILSTVLSFDLVSWALVIDPLLLVKKKEIATHFNKSNWPSCRQKQPHICCHYVYECECNYLACEAPLPLSLPHSRMIMFFCLRYLREKCAAVLINK